MKKRRTNAAETAEMALKKLKHGHMKGNKKIVSPLKMVVEKLPVNVSNILCL